MNARLIAIGGLLVGSTTGSVMTAAALDRPAPLPAPVEQTVPFRVGDTWHDCTVHVRTETSQVVLVECDPPVDP